MEEIITLIMLGIFYLFTIIYSIYVLILNRKQARVNDTLIITNEILEKIYDEVKK